jgi:hypothetical protein
MNVLKQIIKDVASNKACVSVNGSVCCSGDDGCHDGGADVGGLQGMVVFDGGDCDGTVGLGG